jgi:hypothetical protein
MNDDAFIEDGVPVADLPDQERPVVPEPRRAPPPARPDVPEADALDQADEVEPGPRPSGTAPAFDVPEADALDQAFEVPLDDDLA